MIDNLLKKVLDENSYLVSKGFFFDSLNLFKKYKFFFYLKKEVKFYFFIIMV